MSGSTGDEVGLALEAVDALLTTNAAVTGVVAERSYHDVAPVRTTYPFVVYSIQSMDDLEVIGGVRIWSNIEMLVKCYAGGEAPSPNLRATAKAIDTAFSTMSYTTTGGVVIRGRRLRPYAAKEQYDDGPVHVLGGVYRIYSQSS